MSSVQLKSSMSLMSRSLETMSWMSPHRMRTSRSQSSFFCCSSPRTAEATHDSWTCSSTRSRPPLTSFRLCSAGEVVVSAGEVVFFRSLISFMDPLSILEKVSGLLVEKHNARTVVGNDFVITVVGNDNALTVSSNYCKEF